MKRRYKLLLYNIRYGTGRGWKFHTPFPFIGFFKRTRKNTEKISEFLKNYNLDIVGLIEVDGGSYRHYGENQAEFIAQKLGLQVNYNSKYKLGPTIGKIPLMSRQGNAFLTKEVSQNTKIHFFDIGIKRLAIELELEEIVIFLLHLSLTYRTRQWQLNTLVKLMQKVNKPIIVAGDLNMFWGHQEIEMFLAATGLKSMNIENSLTYPSIKPTKQLDFILHSPEIIVHDFKVLEKATFSDHLPVYCEFSVE